VAQLFVTLAFLSSSPFDARSLFSYLLAGSAPNLVPEEKLQRPRVPWTQTRSALQAGSEHSTEKKVGPRSARCHGRPWILVRIQEKGEEQSASHPFATVALIRGVVETRCLHRSTPLVSIK